MQAAECFTTAGAHIQRWAWARHARNAIYQGRRAQLSPGALAALVPSQSARRSCRVCPGGVHGAESGLWSEPCTARASPGTEGKASGRESALLSAAPTPPREREQHARAGPRAEKLLELTSFFLEDGISCSRGPA